MKAAAASVREAWSAEARSVRVLSAGPLVVTADAEWQVAAFEAATGRKAWRYPFSTFPFAVHDRHVLVRGGRGEIHLLDAGTGHPEGCIPHALLDSARVSGRVLFAHRRPGWAEESRVTAVDLATGRRLWMYVGARARTLSGQPDAFAVAEEVAAAGGNGEIVALDAGTGAERWRRAWPDVADGDSMRPATIGPLFLQDHHLVAVVEGRVVCLGLDDGRTVWEDEGAAQVVEGDRIYASIRDRYHVRTIADGALLKRQAATGAPAPLAKLLMADSRVGLVTGRHAFLLAGWSDGEALIAVDRERGKYAWHHQPAGGSHAKDPVAADGRLYYVNGNRLYCLAPPA